MRLWKITSDWSYGSKHVNIRGKSRRREMLMNYVCTSVCPYIYTHIPVYPPSLCLIVAVLSYTKDPGTLKIIIGQQ